MPDANAWPRQDLIKTKFSRPKTAHNLVSRRRISDSLDRALAYALTVVTAPAGYGKSTAVLDWLAKREIPAAWLSLDERDNTPAVFWRYVCAVLDDISPGVARDTEYVFSSQMLLDANIHINILIDRLSAAPADFLLVLDDLHAVTDPSIQKGLSYLIDYLPDKMHLICIGRTEPDMELSKHSMRQRVLRLDQRDLRFAQYEIFRFYQARGHTLGEDDIRRVEAYTEGWAASLVAIAMSMEGGDHDAIAALSQASHDIGRYLRDEVIGTWRPEKRDFAVKTCILDTLSAPLCDAVTGGHDARAMLGELSGGNSFIVALDEEKQEYRYHHLFKNLLNTLLTEAFPDLIPDLHTRAARWYQAQGLMSRAIEHLLSGGAYEEAIEHIEGETNPLVMRADYGTLLSWLARLPEPLRDRSQKAALIHAMYFAEIGRYDLARQWMSRAGELTASDRYASDPERRGELRTSYMLAEANLRLRVGDIGFGNLITSISKRNGDRRFPMQGYFDLNTADIYFSRCPARAVATLFGKDPAKYDTMTREYRTLLSINPGYAPLAPGEYFYESNRLEEALPYLLESMEEARDARCSGALVPAMVGVARIRWAQGDMRGAFDALDECERQLVDIGKGHWLYLLHAFRCRLYIDAGKKKEADAWFASRRTDIYTEIDRIREFELIVYARALLAKDHLQDAQILLQRLLRFTEEADRPHSQVEVLNLLSIVSYGQDKIIKAMDFLERSLSIGVRESYARSFLDEGIPMAYLLRYYATRRSNRAGDASDALRSYARDLLAQMQDRPAAGFGETGAELKKLLTPQERKVLKLLVKAHTNEAIGRQLGIALRTVKTHTGNIYGKLGVKSRAQCVRLAQETKLVP